MKARSRKEACSPRSAGWTLYRPADVANRLNVSLADAQKTLEETGFLKAIRIREALIRRKVEMQDAVRSLHKWEQSVLEELREVRKRKAVTERVFVEIRNILRLPREDADGGA